MILDHAEVETPEGARIRQRLEKVPAPKCVLVEPIPEKLAVGENHFKLNGMKGTFLLAFVGRQSGQLANFEDWGGSRPDIPMVSVDGQIKTLDLSRVDILHADVQGAESEMLIGAEQALREHHIGYLFISTHGCEHRRCLSRLVRHGYKIIAEHSVLESVSGDGLIVARAPEYPGPDQIEISKRKPGHLALMRYHLSSLRRRFGELLSESLSKARLTRA
ncbi:MAG: FkbM family methyltransferase [Burkholderiales bacterium]